RSSDAAACRDRACVFRGVEPRRDCRSSRAAARHRENANPPRDGQAARDPRRRRLMATGPIDHGALRDQIELYVLGALTAPERLQFETHLATCDECRAGVRAMSAVAEALLQAIPQLEPPASLRTRVLTSVTGEKPTSSRLRS